MENGSARKPVRGLVIALADVLLLGLALIVFALFHHVLPMEGEAKLTIVSPPPEDAALEPTLTPEAVQALASATSTPKPTPTPIPEEGDFSASFPKTAPDSGAYMSYADDATRIEIDKVEEDGVTYFVADVWIKNITGFKTAFAQGKYGRGISEAPLKILENEGAAFGVTGDYYGARSRGIVIRNGELYRDEVFNDVCVLYYDGTMETYQKEEFDIDAAIEKKAYQAWSFGPELLDGGEQRIGIKDQVARKNPRCAIGYYEPGHYCLVLVDGRQSGYSSGMTLDELSALFYSLGCKAAYNLDGGQTAVMMLNGEFVNQPYEGGRNVSDILCFGSVK